MNIFRHRDRDPHHLEASGGQTCHHRTLTARWDSVQDMGNEERASAYECSACGSRFTPGEAEGLKVDASFSANRLKT